jgi:hypothetical protein
MTPLSGFLIVLGAVVGIVAYQIGKRIGFAEADLACREQRAPLPPLPETDR